MNMERVRKLDFIKSVANELLESDLISIRKRTKIILNDLKNDLNDCEFDFRYKEILYFLRTIKTRPNYQLKFEFGI